MEFQPKCRHDTRRGYHSHKVMRSQRIQLDHRPCDQKGPQKNHSGHQIPEEGMMCLRWKMPARAENQIAGPRMLEAELIETTKPESEELEVISVARAWPPREMRY